MEFTIYDDGDVASFLEGLEERPQRRVKEQLGKCWIQIFSLRKLVKRNGYCLNKIIDGTLFSCLHTWQCTCLVLLLYCRLPSQMTRWQQRSQKSPWSSEIEVCPRQCEDDKALIPDSFSHWVASCPQPILHPHSLATVSTWRTITIMFKSTMIFVSHSMFAFIFCH